MKSVHDVVNLPVHRECLSSLTFIKLCSTAVNLSRYSICCHTLTLRTIGGLAPETPDSGCKVMLCNLAMSLRLYSHCVYAV